MSRTFLECTCFFLLSLIVNISTDCNNLQPLVDSVPDNNFIASLDSESEHPPPLTKLSSDDAWCSIEVNDLTISPYIQVTFDSPVEIISVAVGGHTAFLIYREYIVNYNIIYRPVGESEQFIINNNTNTPMVFAREGNVDLQTVTLDTPIITDLLQIRALPGSWSSSYDRICIRFEANGCTVPPTSTTTSTPSTSSLSSSLSSEVTTSSIPLSTGVVSLSTTVTTTPTTLSTMQNITSSIMPMTSSNEISISILTTLYSSDDSDMTTILQSTVTSNGNTQQTIASIDTTTITTTTTTITNTMLTAANSVDTDVIVFASSFVGIVIFLLAIIGLVLIIVAVIFMVRRSRRHNDDAATKHRFDNHLYGQSLDDPDSPSHKLPINGGMNETIFLDAGNMYESIDNLLVPDESNGGQNGGQNDGSYKRTENRKHQTEIMLKNDDDIKYETANQYETMYTGLPPIATEKYDYIDKTDLMIKPPPVALEVDASNGIYTKMPANKAETGKIRESIQSNDNDDETILMSPNPMYNTVANHTPSNFDIQLHPRPTESQNSHVPNPLYGAGTSMNEEGQDKSNGVISSSVVSYDDMVDNPLYGGEHIKP